MLVVTGALQINEKKTEDLLFESESLDMRVLITACMGSDVDPGGMKNASDGIAHNKINEMNNDKSTDDYRMYHFCKWLSQI